jgi:hypothetical protein
MTAFVTTVPSDAAEGRIPGEAAVRVVFTISPEIIYH